MERIKFLGHQGDVGLWEVDAIPEELKELSTKTVMRGEATGHHHSFAKGKVRLYGQLHEQPLFFRTESEAILDHQEHDPAVIGKGKLVQIVREREVIPFANEQTRTVSD